MKSTITYPSLLVAAVILLVLTTSGVTPLWLFIPALLFATAIGVGMLAGRWLRTLSALALRMVLVPPALALFAFALYALAVDPTRPFVLWVVLAYALFIILIGAYIPFGDGDAPPKPRARPRNAT